MHVLTLDRLGVIAISAQEPPEPVLAELTRKYGGRLDEVEGQPGTTAGTAAVRTNPHYYWIAESQGDAEPGLRSTGAELDCVSTWGEFLTAVRGLDADAAMLVWASVLRNIGEVLPFSSSW